MESYHLRRAEKAIRDEDVLWEIIAGQKYMTLAMCSDDTPYLVTVNYAYERSTRCFYFHCAHEGRKVVYLRHNPSVWVQILEDHGYLTGACNHAFRSVQFSGTASFVQEPDEKIHALTALVERLESDPAPVRARLINEVRLPGVTIGKIHAGELTGKQNGV